MANPPTSPLLTLNIMSHFCPRDTQGAWKIANLEVIAAASAASFVALFRRNEVLLIFLHGVRCRASRSIDGNLGGTLEPQIELMSRLRVIP